MRKQFINDMITLADSLDAHGLTKEASEIDRLLKEAANEAAAGAAERISEAAKQLAQKLRAGANEGLDVYVSKIRKDLLELITKKEEKPKEPNSMRQQKPSGLAERLNH